MARLQALSLGHALELESAGVGAVHSVFARAVNLEVRDELWTLLCAERADLPFGIRVGTSGFDLLGLHRGDRVSVRSGFVGISCGGSALVVDCRATPRWQPRGPDARAPGLAARLRIVAAAATHRAWPGAAAMAQAVVCALDDPLARGNALAAVVGCGPGSTPAGDDVLVGILAVLTSPHADPAGAAAARSLRGALSPLLACTTDISAHLLRQAARGWVARPVHELVGALIGGAAPDQLRERTRQVLAMGATSGADLCMGLLAAAPSFLPIHDEAMMTE